MSKFKMFKTMCVVMVLGCSEPALAEMIPGAPVAALGYCQLSPVAATALSSCAGGIPAGANLILMSADTANIRWRDDGVAPTSSIGMNLVFGQAPITYNGPISKLQFISATGVLNVTFYKSP